jgi:ubiquinone/menaquinone biosynthesis C-methylase UbiE
MSYWKTYWNTSAKNKSLLQQVQRNTEDSNATLLLIEEHIKTLLQLKYSDCLLDVCCGNGIVTKSLSKHCKSTEGIDFSPQLIKNAKLSNSSSTIKYSVGDATRLAEHTEKKFDKIVLYFSFQYFSYDDGLKVVSEMKKLLKPNGIILLGDIPDRKFFWNYYNTFPKRFFYFKQWIFKQPKMGKFWSEKEMNKIAEATNLKGVFLKQNKNLPHWQYRFDFLLH